MIETLMKLEEDMFHDRMRKDHIRTPAEASQKCEGVDRHKNGMSIDNKDIKVILITEYLS